MSTPLFAAARPCPTCPYRRDVPSGIWDRSEYLKLPRFDENLAFGVFHCHQENATGIPTVCRGWLTVHCESVAARIAVLDGRVTDEQRYAAVDVELYGSGTEAAEAGLAAVECPDVNAIRTIQKLAERRVGHHYEGE